jgi:tRNA nucleotidyltransferase (CCA-adding enzyme)
VRVSPSHLRERVRRLPELERLLPALQQLPPTYLVGGAVRDLLRRAQPRDIDLAVEGSPDAAARALADHLGRQLRAHERFGVVELSGAPRINVAMTRREAYERPGALPTVEEASLEEDLARRDFSVNAMAVGLHGDDLGHLYDLHGGVEDLEAGALRVLHDASFEDDPTRLLRALRYEARLSFVMEPDTERLALAAIAGGALATVSGDRIGSELMLLLGEDEVRSAVRRMRGLELDHELHPDLEADPQLVLDATLIAEEVHARRALSGLAALVSGAPQQLDLWLADLGLKAHERDAVSRAARVAPRLATELREREHSPSELAALLRREPPEALALALAMHAPTEAVLRWVNELSGVGLEIGGDDLVAAGVPQGPALGRALDETLRRKLDGLVDGREDELRTALEIATEER